MRKALVAGSFDPFTNGHLSIVKTAAELFDEVFVVTFTNRTKNRMYSADGMMDAVQKALKREGLSNCHASWEHDKLLSRYCIKNGIQYSVRGLRNNIDYNYEENMSCANKLVYKDLKTIYIPSEMNAVASSTIKELMYYGEDVSVFLPPEVYDYMKNIWKTESHE